MIYGMGMKTPKTPPEKLADQAYRFVLERIRTRAWPPGFLLNRRMAAAELGMSPAPVLEALVRLENEGVVESLPRKGTRVCLARPADIYGLMIVREALEAQAVRLLTPKALRKRLPELRGLAAEIDRGTLHSVENYQREVTFHRTLVELAECPALLQAYDRIMTASLFLQYNMVGTVAAGAPLRRHSDLLRELAAAKTPEAAEAAVRRHNAEKIAAWRQFQETPTP